MAINSTSFSNTPQASDDAYSWQEDQLSGSAIMVLDVLADDLGGKAKTLYSIDNGDALADLLARDPGLTTAWESTAEGNHVRINAGKIEYQLSAQNDLNGLNVGDGYADSFQYAIQLGNGTLSWATVTVQVAGQNDGPQAVADTGDTTENQAVTIDVLANDTDADAGHAFTLLSVDGPEGGQGSASVVDGKVVFDPGTDFDHLAQGDTASVTLTYWMQDEHGAKSSSTVVVTVTGTNDAPVAVPDAAAGGENEVVTVDVLANDTDVDEPHTLSVASASAPAGQGSASVVNDQVVFDPGTDFDGLNVGQNASVSVSYTLQDEHGEQSVSTVAVTISGSNDAAVISGTDSVTASETDAPLALGGTLTATDVDNDDGFQASSADGDYGDFAIDAAGAWSYTANSAFDELNVGDSVSESFTVKTVDGTEGSVAVEIEGTNDAALISGTTAITASETNAPLALSGTLAATDVDNDEGFQASTAGGTYGEFAIDATGAWSYTANGAFDELNVGDSYEESFAVHTVDGTAGSVSFDIQGVNDSAVITGAPTGATVSEDSGSFVIGGDLDVIDPDNPLTFQAVASADLQGTYGSFSFDPATGQWGYTLANGSQAVQELDTGDVRYDSLNLLSADGTATATLQVAVQGLDDVASFTPPPAPVTTNTVTGSQSTLTGTAANDLIDAGNGADTLVGGAGDDFLDGGNGQDVLIGGPGDDHLLGGNSPDTYRFSSVADATDVILDFTSDDQIVFQGPITGGGASLALVAVDTNGDSSVDATLLQVDSNGAAAGGTVTDMAVVIGVPDLTMSDVTWIV